MKITQIPHVYSIMAGTPPLGTGEIITDTSKRVLLSIGYWGELFSTTGAEIRMFEPTLNPPLTPLTKFGGLWEIDINQITRFQGFLENLTKERARGGNILTFQLRSVLCAWDIELTNQTFGITGSGADHIVNTMSEYLSYLINTVVPMTVNSGCPLGIQFNGTIPSNSITFDTLYEDGILSVTGSTYLAEIQRACQALGFILFANPFSGDVQMINALNPPGNYFSILDEDKMKANFAVDETSIPATVLVNDDILNKGVAYGHLPSTGGVDDTNFAMTGINNLAFATTVGMKENSLSGIAKNIFDISRKSSQILTVKKAGLETYADRRGLGEILTWSDSSQRVGDYVVSSFRATIQPSEMSLEIKAYVK